MIGRHRYYTIWLINLMVIYMPEDARQENSSKSQKSKDKNQTKSNIQETSTPNTLGIELCDLFVF